MKSTLKSIALILLGAAIVACSSIGCNTASGLGKDVEKLGDKIQEKSGK
jgi:predicted small secreted protein